MLNMNILDLIEKKKNNHPLNEKEYKFFIDNFNQDLIPDYQASALLMAIRINGCSDEETYYLTKAMLNTCKIIKPKANNKLKLLIDKHSSGGVGDKITLIISPILASLGYDIMKLSGRGLNFTGGTIDKLESINVRMKFDENNYQDFLNSHHFTIYLQSNNFAHIDKKLYHLRDVTGSVDSLPLIASSILCKKFCFETNYIFLDIKVGTGAFCKDMSTAKELARIMQYLAKKFNRKLICFITNMNSPLGKNIGNAIEIKESLEFLNGNFESKYLKNLIYDILSEILIETKQCNNKQDAFKIIDDAIYSKDAYNRFINFVKANNGSWDKLNHHNYWNYNFSTKIKSKHNGYINFKSTEKIGYISLKLGAGRIKKEDEIDYNAGIILNVENNDYINIGDEIATLYSNTPIDKNLVNEFYDNLEFLSNPNIDNIPKINLIIK